MQYRRFGRVCERVSAIGFGGAALSGEGGGYGFGKISDDKALELIHYAWERGVNLFDTAPLYGKGLSERRLGQALKKIREQVVIVSKCGLSWKPSGRIDHHNDPKLCRQMLEQSLRDLQSDYIDLYMVHYPDSKVDIRFTVEELAHAQREGKIGHIGLCNTNQQELARAQEVASIDAIQNQFHFFEVSELEALTPSLGNEDIGVMGWGTLHKGILTGTASLDRNYEDCDIRSWAPWFRKDKKIMRQINWAQEELLPHLQAAKVSPCVFALQFALGFAPIPLSTALCGFRTKKQLDDLVDGLERAIEREFVMPLLKAYEKFEYES